MKIVKKIVLFIFVVILAGYFSVSAINLYDKFFDSGSTFVQLNALAGFPFAYIFFLTLLFAAFGGNKKYWWIGILLIPTVAFELSFDLDHIYFPVALGVIGWFIGFLISKLLSRFHKTDATV